jgi:hypothetical protein
MWSGGQCASSRHPHVHALTHARRCAHSGSRAERCGLRRAAPLRRTPHLSHARRRSGLPSHYAPRTCTPAPSHGPNFEARAMHPSRGDFSTLSDPPNWGWPSPGFEAPFVLVRQAEKAAEEAAQVRSHTLNVLRLHRNGSDVPSCGTPHCVDSRLLLHARMRCRRRRPRRRRSRRPRRRR